MPNKINAIRLYDHDNAQVIHMTIPAGEALKPHITPVDVFFYVLEGTLDVLVGEETIAVGKDNLVESPKGIIHCLSNNSQSIARVLVVKAPKPTT
ncbi:MAG: cupin domain-containing protein [Methanolobus sp.]|nr:cupin domain-containing protein [Methanolobus sp.]